ncbi:type II secretion system protein GspI [Exilibacterium tricleocarpae]|uniref:Type II secretion system protein I n=1 Tax=Exilibacterium tricleocarpae TaxID=2591008 RepID=A0A545TZ73_9GAMM|nr:type II secretion system minor pseudopilin GspI [Exilibacterium tricleocarpae]TQV82511.1 type II secretion system protein GspI [Exilibacterium tricleocarpae]
MKINARSPAHISACDCLKGACGCVRKSACGLVKTRGCVKKGTRGFTLVEVLVALAIVSMALPALLHEVQGQTSHTSYMRDRTIAQWIAQNKMTELRVLRRLNNQVFKGTASDQVEMAGTTWTWYLEALETPVEGMKRMEVRVSLGDKEKEESLVMLAGFVHE